MFRSITLLASFILQVCLKYLQCTTVVTVGDSNAWIGDSAERLILASCMFI